MEQGIGLIVGIILLFFGGEWLVKAASRIAASFGLPALLIGMTIVAFGTSTPELVVSVSAAIEGSSDIAVGNVVGSNIANIGLILGLCGLILPLTVHINLIRREIPIMILVSLVLTLLSLDGEVGRVEGGLLVVGYLVFLVVSYYLARLEPQDTANEEEVESEVAAIEGKPKQVNRNTEIGRFTIAIVMLVIGAQLTVDGAVALARAVGISELAIGLTLVAVGTSLPEIATSLVAAYRRHADIAIGNVVGSNIANILAILGLAAFISPVKVAPMVIQFDMPFMLLFAVLLIGFVIRRVLGRWQAIAFLVIYFATVIFTFVR
jgi:cation:H+ antiporter